MSLKDVNKKIFLYGGIIIVAAIVLVVVLIMIKPDAIGKQSYEGIENELVKAAKKYYEKNPSFLSTSETVFVDSTTLETEKMMKPLAKMIKEKEVTCTAKVEVKPKGSPYLYFPYLNCGSAYETRGLKDVILDTKNIVTKGNGLYLLNKNHYFRGELVNNYVDFAGKIWRILNVYEDGTIRLLEQNVKEEVIWDNRYNVTEKGVVGINDYEKSRIRETVINLYYNDAYLTEKDRQMIANQNLCLDKKGKTDAISYATTCKRVLKDPIGLAYANDYGIASLDATCKKISDPQCQNYNYMSTTISRGWWTVTASSLKTDLSFVIGSKVSETSLTSDSRLRPTILLRSDVLYKKGNGSETDPYVIKQL